MNESQMTLKDLLVRSAEKYPERPALAFVGDESVNYGTFLEWVNDFGVMLRGCGINPGDKVAIISENMPNWAVTYFAVTSMGAVAVPILQEFHASAVHHILRHSEAKAVVASDRYMHKVEGDNFPNLKICVRMDDLSLVEEDEPDTPFADAVAAARAKIASFSGDKKRKKEAEKAEDAPLAAAVVELPEEEKSAITEAVDAARDKFDELSDMTRRFMEKKDDDAKNSFSDAMEAARDKFEEFSDKARKYFDTKRSEKTGGELTPDSVAAILYTSGTTGHSKGVVLTHGNLVSNVLAGVKTIPIYESDRFLSVLPMAHTYECTVGLLVPVYCGSSIHYLRKPPTPKTLLPAMQKVKPTVMSVVPLIIEKIYKKRIKPKLNRGGLVGGILKLGAARRKISRIAGKKLIEAFGGELRCMCIGGAALAPEVELFLSEAEVPYAIGYGMTETSPLLAGVRPGRQRLRAIGPPLEGVELKIDDPDPKTGEGEILAKGPNVMREYYKAPKDTADTFTEDGFLRTGDLGVFDKDNYLYIKGRLKNVIIGPSGENIYPEEVESIINSLDFVMESLVYDNNGQLCARVHLNYDALDEEFSVNKMIESEVRAKVEELLLGIKKEVNSKVSSFAKLAKVAEQVDPFEKTPTQKIKRFLYLDK